MTTTPDYEPYQPSGGLEGAVFMASFCDLCARDAAFRNGSGDSCAIAADTMVHMPGDPEYPREWTYDADGEPTCTAFDPESRALTGRGAGE